MPLAKTTAVIKASVTCSLLAVLLSPPDVQTSAVYTEVQVKVEVAVAVLYHRDLIERKMCFISFRPRAPSSATSGRLS